MDLLGLPGPAPDPVPDGELICRKVWLACDEHREHLEQFLASRSFWKQTVAVAELDRVS